MLERFGLNFEGLLRRLYSYALRVSAPGQYHAADNILPRHQS